MKVDQKELARKLKPLKSIVTTKGIYAGNDGVLFKDGTLTANNLEIGITVSLPTDESAEFILPIKAIEMIDSLSGEIDISASANGRVVIKSDNGTSRFQAPLADDFQGVKTLGSKEKTCTLDAKEVENALERVLYACAVNGGSKEQLQGVLFEGDGEHLNIVACDGCRLAWNKIPYKDEINVIIPKTSLQKAFSIGLDGDLRLTVNGTGAVIESGDYTIYTRIYAGEYINYCKMFADAPCVFKVNRAELLGSLTRAQICNESKITSPVVLKSDGRNLNISLQTALSEFSEDIELSDEPAEKIDIAFNGAYLIEMLKSFDEATIECCYTSPVKPMVFSGEIMRAVVVPIRLN